jgi:hypothetical protein
MINLIRTTLRLALSIFIIVSALFLLNAWVFKQTWMNYLWVNLSYLLHQEWFAVSLVALIYLTAFLFMRWHLIAWPIRCDLLGRITDVTLQLDMEALDSPEKKAKIDAMRLTLRGAVERLNQTGPLDRILWTRGHEEAAWSQVDNIECKLAIMQSFERVKARLETAERDLREILTKDAGDLADLIHTELASTTSEISVRDNRFRSLLQEALDLVDTHDENDLDDTLNWHNKTVWLTWLGVMLLVSLEGTRRGGGGLFAAGAAGGFLSRLMRAIKRVDDPADSSAYWTTLSLSPLVGALAGWTGILLVELGFKLGVLGSTFSGVTMENGYGSFALALAFLLGFSERLFDAITQSVEDKVDKKAEAKGTPSPKPPTKDTEPQVNRRDPKAPTASSESPGSDTSDSDD